MSKIKTTLLGLALGCVASSAVLAQSTTTLRVATWAPNSNPQNAVVWPTWAKWVKEATEGRVDVEIINYTGHPKSIFSGVEDGIYDVGFSVNAYLSGRFLLTSIAEIPGETIDAASASSALWRVQQEYFKSANEYDGLTLLGMFVHAPGQMQTTFPVNSLEDLKGKKIRLGGGMVNELAKRLDVTPVIAPASKSYEMLQQGIVEGTFLPTGEQKSYRLAEVTSDLTLFPNGLYTTVFSIVMNPYTFDQLSEKDQKAIMSVSGEKLSRMAGKAWQEDATKGITYAKENGVNVVILDKNDPRVIEMGKLTKGIDQVWLDSVADRKVDAKGALAAFRQYVKE